MIVIDDQTMIYIAALLLLCGTTLLCLTARGLRLVFKVLYIIPLIILPFLSIYGVFGTVKVRKLHYAFTTRIPISAYEGESFIISFGICTRAKDSSSSYLDLDYVAYPDAIFSVQLQSPSFERDVSPELTIGPVIDGKPPKFADWVVHAKASGNQTLLFKVIHNNCVVGEYKKRIRINKIFGLTQTQVYEIGWTVTLISALALVWQVLYQLLK